MTLHFTKAWAEKFAKEYRDRMFSPAQLAQDWLTLHAENEALTAQLRNAGIVPYLDRMRELAQRIEQAEAALKEAQEHLAAIDGREDELAGMVLELEAERDRLRAALAALRPILEDVMTHPVPEEDAQAVSLQDKAAHAVQMIDAILGGADAVSTSRRLLPDPSGS